MPFHQESLCGATLINVAYRVCDGLRRNKILRVGKKSRHVLSRLSTKVHEIFGQCRPMRPFVLSSALARLSMSRFVQKIFAIKCQSCRKPEQM